MKLEATLGLDQSANRVWDAVVVGAGPAGSLAAYGLAGRGVSILLVDRAAFPRPKVCGSCLNELALTILEEAGLQHLLSELRAQPIRRFLFFGEKRRAAIPLLGGAVLSREAFDAALVREAIRKGSEFLPETYAVSEGLRASTRSLILQRGGKKISVEAQVVLMADGLGGTFLKNEKNLETKIARLSRIGVNAAVKEASAFYSSETIFMACARGGYVGLVRLEDGRLNIAAALDPQFLKETEGPGRAIRAILRENNLPSANGWETLPWRGTPELTRHRSRLASERLFVLGDAASYVEPFTGEGITWALASGIGVVPFALEAVRVWRPGLATQWNQFYSRTIGNRQKICSLVTRFLRQPVLTRSAFEVLTWKPSFAEALIRSINSPFELGYPL